MISHHHIWYPWSTSFWKYVWAWMDRISDQISDQILDNISDHISDPIIHDMLGLTWFRDDTKAFYWKRWSDDGMTDGQTECQRVDPSGRRGRVKIQIFIQYDISYSFGKNTLLLSSADFEQQWLPLNGSYAKKGPYFRNSHDGSLHMVLSLKNFPSEKCRGEGILAK